MYTKKRLSQNAESILRQPRRLSQLGFRKLGELIKAINLFEIDERTNPMVPGKQVYLRIKHRGRN